MKDREGIGLSNGLASIAGTVTVQPGWQFRLTDEDSRPIRNSSFLVPAVTGKTLEFTTLKIVASNGAAYIDNPKMSRQAILSLSNTFYGTKKSDKQINGMLFLAVLPLRCWPLAQRVLAQAP